MFIEILTLIIVHLQIFYRYYSTNIQGIKITFDVKISKHESIYLNTLLTKIKYIKLGLSKYKLQFCVACGLKACLRLTQIRILVSIKN